MTRTTYTNIAQTVLETTASHRRIMDYDHNEQAVFGQTINSRCTCGEHFNTSTVYVPPVSAIHIYQAHTAEVIADLTDMQPDLIEHRHELAALEQGSVIRDATGTMMQLTYNVHFRDDIAWCQQDGSVIQHDDVVLPVHVWWTPESDS